MKGKNDDKFRQKSKFKYMKIFHYLTKMQRTSAIFSHDVQRDTACRQLVQSVT